MTGTTTVDQTNNQTGEKPFTMNDVPKKYFAPDQLPLAAELMQKVLALPEAEKNVFRNFDDDHEFADGWGIAVIPIGKREKVDGESVTNTVAVAIAVMPDPSLVMQDEKGQQFVRDSVIDAFMAKAANSVRTTDANPDPDADAMPKSLVDYIERRGGGENLKVFNDIAPAFVKQLKKMGLKLMTQQGLRQVLSSKAYAEIQYPKIPQAQWELLLQAMAADATKKGKDDTIFAKWLETRAQASAEIVEEVDFGKEFAGLLDSDDGDNSDDDEENNE